MEMEYNDKSAGPNTTYLEKMRVEEQQRELDARKRSSQRLFRSGQDTANQDTQTL